MAQTPDAIHKLAPIFGARDIRSSLPENLSRLVSSRESGDVSSMMDFLR